MSVRCFVSRLIVAFGALMAFWCAPALAGVTHPFLSSFGSFSNVQGVAVDQNTGDVYVLDAGSAEGSLFKFDASGKPLKFTGLPGEPLSISGLHAAAGGSEDELAVDSSAGPAKGDIYVAASTTNGEQIDIIAPDGESLGALSKSTTPWGETCGVAVDSSGNVYVGVYEGYVDKFVPTANPVTNSDYTSSIVGADEPCNIAVDTHGNVFTARYGGGPVELYEASQFGQLSATGWIVETHGSTLAVNPADNHLYVDAEGEVSEFGAKGEPFETPLTVFGHAGSKSFGIAVAETGGDIYVSDGNGKISVYGPDVVVPGTSVQEATAVTGESATLNGTVNPEGLAVSSCQFEYAAGDEALTNTSPCDPLPGAGTAAVTVSASITELAPGAYYHYRLRAENVNGVATSQEGSFRTVAPLGLPDHRLYERVSPKDNADGNAYSGAPSDLAYLGFATELPFVASPDGDAFTYTGGPAEKGGIGIQGSGGGDQYLATRAPGGGWNAHNVTPYSSSILDHPRYVGFSPDLSVGFLNDSKNTPLVAGAPKGGYSLLYQNSFASETLQPLLTVTPPNRGSEEFEMEYAGSSADLKHVLYAANDALAQPSLDPGSNPGQYNLFDDREGALIPVNVLPNGSPEPDAYFGGPGLPDLRYSSYELTESPNLTNVISEDGRRVFWTAAATHNLYVREDNERTVQVDAAVGGGSQYWTATPDGSKVLFTKGGDLYEYDLDTAQTTNLVSGEVVNVIATTRDLSYVYFIARGVLAPGAEAQTCKEGGDCNMYVLHSGQPPEFISKLSYDDKYARPEGIFRTAGAWADSMANKEAQLSSDGTHLVFGSDLSLTGYQAGGREEIYMYDYAGSHITCLSCDHTGALSPHPFIGAYLPISNLPTHLPRWMSQDGNRVFFDSVQPLVAQDTNGANDVYEWQREGTGGCAEREGCVYMLSGGTGVEGSFLDEASADGNDVFIGTREALVSEDENETVDIYDVHANAEQPPVAPQCTGTGCQGLPSAPPVFSTPASVTYDGVGDFPVPPRVVSKAKKSKSKTKSNKNKSKRKQREKKTSKRKHKAVKAATKHKTYKGGRGK